jgi:dephospho-CoA kinase
MIRVGLTGGIGVGKTTISKLFEKLGIPVFNSDLSARNAENDINIQEQFKKILGKDIFIDGKLDRPKMRSMVFVDKEKLKQINEIVIPFVGKEFEEFIERNSNAPYVILESAILFETGSDKLFDITITVTADMIIRIGRVLERDGITLEEINNKIKNQLPEKNKIAKSTFVIINNGKSLTEDLDVLFKQVETIHKAIIYEWVVFDSTRPIDDKWL